MEIGFVCDRLYADIYWMEGVHEQSQWVGMKISEKARYPVLSYRCISCGFLESYARRPDHRIAPCV